jgi:hypothetical protein
MAHMATIIPLRNIEAVSPLGALPFSIMPPTLINMARTAIIIDKVFFILPRY